MNKKIKNRIVFYTMLLVLFVIVNIVVSFAYLRGKANYNESVSTIAIEGVGNINVVYSGNTSNIEAHDIVPGYKTEKKFTVTSNISSGGTLYKRGIWYQIKLIVDTNGFLSGSLVYSLSLDGNSSTDGITALPVDKIAIPNGANSDGILIGTGYFSSDNVSHIYNLKINYVNLEDVDQSNDYQKKFAAHVVIDNPRYVNLTFDLDGGSFANLNLNSNSTMKVAANSTINLPIPNKEGYIFAGWEVVSVDVSTNINVISTGNNDVSIKALWNDNIPYEFAYTGGEQQFIAEVPGYYKIETWGAQGGNGHGTYGTGGYGGYSVGIISLIKDQKIYLNVGGKGVTPTSVNNVSIGGYNGGGSTYGWANTYNGSGGGATHISYDSGLLSSLASHATDNRILIVGSGGGGGAADANNSNAKGGSGGGYIGSDGDKPANNDGAFGLGGGQEKGGSYTLTSSRTAPSKGIFGQGGNAATTGGSGGGSGYFGGGGGSVWGGAGGGSGYIGNSLLTNKYMYCYNCETSDVESTKTYTTKCAEEIPTENCAKKGNGYARITYLHS